MHLLAVALLAHPSGELLFMLLDRMLTMLATSAVFLFDGGCAVAVLFILVCGVALLQSKLIKAPGHWTQHGASAIQLNKSRNMSRTCTSAAELFLFAPYALVRSSSMWRQRGWHQPQHSSPNVWCRLHCETATERLPTGMSNNNYALGESVAGIISPISETATEHPPNGGAEHGVLCDKALHADMAHATRASSLRPCGQCRHALGPLHMFSRIYLSQD